MNERAKDQASTPPAITTCPECGSPDLSIISDTEYITIAKCQRCGKLLAPVKKH